MTLWASVLVLLHMTGWARSWLDLPALALIAVSWGAPRGRAVPRAWVLGLVLDSVSEGPLGLQAGLWALGAAALSVEQRAAHRAELPTLMLAAGLSSILLGLLTGWLGVPGIWPPGFLPVLLGRGAAAAIAAPILLRWAWRGAPA